MQTFVGLFFPTIIFTKRKKLLEVVSWYYKYYNRIEKRKVNKHVIFGLSLGKFAIFMEIIHSYYGFF